MRITKAEKVKLKELIEEYAAAHAAHEWQQDQGYRREAILHAAERLEKAKAALDAFLA